MILAVYTALTTESLYLQELTYTSQFLHFYAGLLSSETPLSGSKK